MAITCSRCGGIAPDTGTTLDCKTCRQPEIKNTYSNPFGEIRGPIDTSRIYEKYHMPQFLSPGPELAERRDEQLWTKYAKAALTGLIFDEYIVVGKSLAQDVAKAADAMLEAHKKRWGDE